MVHEFENEAAVITMSNLYDLTHLTLHSEKLIDSSLLKNLSSQKLFEGQTISSLYKNYKIFEKFVTLIGLTEINGVFFRIDSCIA